jgi:hypothetical protein
MRYVLRESLLWLQEIRKLAVGSTVKLARIITAGPGFSDVFQPVPVSVENSDAVVQPVYTGSHGVPASALYRLDLRFRGVRSEGDVFNTIRGSDHYPVSATLPKQSTAYGALVV